MKNTTNQWERTQMILSSKQFCEIQNSHVVVVGLGGVGGYVCEALARSGVSKLTIIDHDTISISNINRQIIATHSTIGQKKSFAIKNRLTDINPNIIINEYDIFVDANSINSIDFSSVNYIVDAIDTITAKLLLIEFATKNNIRIISSMGTGNKFDGSKFEITDIYKTSVCPLAKVMRKELKVRGIKKLKVLYSSENPASPVYPCDMETQRKMPPGSISFVPSIAGLLIAQTVIHDLIGL